MLRPQTSEVGHTKKGGEECRVMVNFDGRVDDLWWWRRERVFYEADRGGSASGVKMKHDRPLLRFPTWVYER